MAFKPKNTEERILHRLKIAQGHLAKVLDMAKSGSYCIDVLHQSNAVQRALKERGIRAEINPEKIQVFED